MAIPKKCTRQINVDGHSYRWITKIDYDYSMKFFIIESQEDNRYQIQGGFDYELNFVISPSMIKQAIQIARENGWEPGISNVRKMAVDSKQIVISE